MTLISLSGLFSASAEEEALTKSALIESNVVYLRVGSVVNGLAAEVSTANATLTATDQVIGTILDLRFAGGSATDEAGMMADYYSSRKLPLAVLINAQTSGAAASLARALRKEHAALVFGSPTAGLTPDIVVTADLNDQKKFMANPYALLATNDPALLSATNDLLPFVDHLSEADLVREKVKDGDDDEDAEPAARPAPSKPVIRDPVLARAVDLLKGLAVVRASQR